MYNYTIDIFFNSGYETFQTHVDLIVDRPVSFSRDTFWWKEMREKMKKGNQIKLNVKRFSGD